MSSLHFPNNGLNCGLPPPQRKHTTIRLHSIMNLSFRSYFELAIGSTNRLLSEVSRSITWRIEELANSAFVSAMHRWVFACYLLIYAMYWCVIQDLTCLVQVSTDKFKECMAKKNELAENLLSNVVHASFLQQTVLIFIFVVVPVFVLGTICMCMFPKRKVRMNDGTHKNGKQNHTIDKSASSNSPVKKPQRRGALHPMTPSPPRSPARESPQQKQQSPIRTIRGLNIFHPRSSNEVKVALEPLEEKESLTPMMGTLPEPGTYSEPPSQTASLADDERTVDNSSEMYTDYGTEAGASKTYDDQDFPYVLRKCVANSRVLVGWRIFLPTLKKGGTEGVILSTVKRPFGATKFLVELQDGSLVHLALKRNARKGDVPFSLLEKTTYEL